jgi:hypothetical protein
LSRQEPEREGSPLPARATGIFLGVWIAVLLILAFVVVPNMFAACMPSDMPLPTPTP